MHLRARVVLESAQCWHCPEPHTRLVSGYTRARHGTWVPQRGRRKGGLTPTTVPQGGSSQPPQSRSRHLRARGGKHTLGCQKLETSNFKRCGGWSHWDLNPATPATSPSRPQTPSRVGSLTGLSTSGCTSTSVHQPRRPFMTATRSAPSPSPTEREARRPARYIWPRPQAMSPPLGSGQPRPTAGR